jgi:hypothetical protein
MGYDSHAAVKHVGYEDCCMVTSEMVEGLPCPSTVISVEIDLVL